ncbi:MULTISPECIES: hypothetical protein [unclassified Adlercreutzia]|uniref:hypothetical protein n=1 Tax=unclassified Adlercreutzia TaxID=2636013 RepID=UPI0013EBD53B|nr:MULTISPECIES: hypothetical protein [unclassified Adlercreutzia]
MGHGKNKKQRMVAQLDELELKKRSGLIRVLAAIVVFVVVTAVKQALIQQGVELASHMVANMLFYLMVLVLAGVAGFGARDWSRASNEISAIRAKLGR